MRRILNSVFAASLICGLVAATTGCKSGKAVKETNESDDMTENNSTQYIENKKIADDNYDKSLAVKCINGTFVGKKTENVIAYKGIPFVGQQPVGNLRWKAPVDVTPNDGVYEAYNYGKAPVRMKASAKVHPFTIRAKTACI